MHRRRPLCAAFVALALSCAAAPAAADPVEDALVDLFGALVLNALGVPPLPEHLDDIRSLPAVAAEPPTLLYTVLDSGDHAPGWLETLTLMGTRWVRGYATDLPVSGWSELTWDDPVWLGGRRVLVARGRFEPPNEAARESWALYFVVGRDGQVREVGTLPTPSYEATQHTDGQCVWFASGPRRCWDAARQTLR